MYCISKIRDDRLEGVPLKPRILMNKNVRGSMEEAFTGCVSVVNWKDSKLVSLASNKLKAEPMQKAKKWDRIYTKLMF